MISYNSDALIDGTNYGLFVSRCGLAKCSDLFDGDLWTGEISTDVGKDLIEQLFDDTSSGCAAGWDFQDCNLGVPPADVFLGRNGWSYPCSINPNGQEPCTTRDNVAAEWGSP